MSTEKDSDLYMRLFDSKGQGNYLLYPPTYEDLHPGFVGFYNSDEGVWHELADLSDPDKLKAKGFTKPPSRALQEMKADETTWDSRTSESESQSSLRGNVGASGAAAGVPVEGSVDLKYKKGSSGKAAVVAKSVVKFEMYKEPFGMPIKEWVQENAKALLGDCKDNIEKYGLWAVQTVYIADECVITMNKGNSLDIDLGADVGATGFGKIGGGRALMEKLDSQGWSSYDSKPGSKGRVISFGGVKFKPRNFSKLFRSSLLKEVAVMESSLSSPTAKRPIFDEEENLTGFEDVRRVRREDGEFDIMKFDRAPSRNDEESSDEDELECEGISEEDVQAEKQYQEEQKQEREQVMLKNWEEFVAETENLNKQAREANSQPSKSDNVEQHVDYLLV
ncbi:hypothetical protein N7495_004841 [Penicillium taxi]|uniref:uncharacterized protein n=1 Tax=Penicillium taxi TaxID=168475 RepID=UPI0025451DED|nr:uncharacterized protein N7495_004841 [Penicillium taxi]KAJ5900097.1 hypothetical protein N7495_004841 [Penicillium taxi]